MYFHFCLLIIELVLIQTPLLRQYSKSRITIIYPFHILLPPVSSGHQRMLVRSPHDPDRILRDIHREPGHPICHVCSWCQKTAISRLGRMPFNIPVLPSLLETRVQVCPDNPFIEFRSTNVFQAIECILMRIIFDKTETTRGLVEPIESHHKALDLAAPIFLSVRTLSAAGKGNRGMLTWKRVRGSAPRSCRRNWNCLASKNHHTSRVAHPHTDFPRRALSHLPTDPVVLLAARIHPDCTCASCSV